MSIQDYFKIHTETPNCKMFSKYFARKLPHSKRVSKIFNYYSSSSSSSSLLKA